MANVEIDEGYLNQLRQAYSLQEKLYSSPKAKRDYEKALKEEFGDKFQTSEEKAAPLLAHINDELKELRAWKQKKEEKEEDDNATSVFSSLRDQGYTDEGIAEIKKIMVERNTADPEVAAAYFEKKQPPKPIAGFGETGWNFTENAGNKDSEEAMWFTDPSRMIDKIAHEELSKPRNVVRR